MAKQKPKHGALFAMLQEAIGHPPTPRRKPERIDTDLITRFIYGDEKPSPSNDDNDTPPTEPSQEVA